MDKVAEKRAALHGTRLRYLDRISRIEAADWNQFFDPNYPFVRHEFLKALETSGCISKSSGWSPGHAILESRTGEILAAAPLYRKAHSYGEFVFDFSWANASHQLGQHYYPKWLIAAPFTPSSGPRFGAHNEAARQHLVQGLSQAFAREGVSSLHALFIGPEDAACAAAAGAIERSDVQFHWRDRNYRDFSGFVATLSSDKRKKILRERRRVSEAGLRFETRAGDDLTEAQWVTVFALYSNTYEERGQAPYLNLEFFLSYAQAPGSPYRLILAYQDQRMVAVALTVQGGDTLYGRHWGAAEHFHSLHFETCYYQGIDYCLSQGLQHFDAGAQGEHKLARGFEPVLTTSAHWLADDRLRSAVEHAMKRERVQVASWREALEAHRPFKKESSDPALQILPLELNSDG